MPTAFSDDLDALCSVVNRLPRHWPGKQSILAMRDAKYQWRQMEWWAFYFELLVRDVLPDGFVMPGDKFGRTKFDLKGRLNWDLKTKAVKSDETRCIFNDCEAVDRNLDKNGQQGLIIVLCDVLYNDESRTFEKWRLELQGGKRTPYSEAKRASGAWSRYRKTEATMVQVVFLEINTDNRSHLDVWKQGKNSNGKPRRPKYAIDLEGMEPFERHRLTFSGV